MGAESSDRGRFLIIEDEPLEARALVRAIKRRSLGDCVVSSTEDEARAQLADGSTLIAIVVDITLHGRAVGLDILAEARAAAHSMTPALVLSGSNEPQHINRATALDARYLVKGGELQDIEEVMRFLSDAVSLCRRVNVALRPRNLPPALHQILLRYALGDSREAIATARGTSPKTVKRQIASLTEQSPESTFDAVVAAVLRAVARSR